ncbi:MAG: phosphatase PAP2 family protein, partial [Prevotella sp.]|nr:phosphatase PAP2 family protein [Prevotella sp.]
MGQYKQYHGDGIDGVLQYVPIASVYVLKGAGVGSQSSWKRMVVNTATSFAIDVGLTYALKYSVHSTRPDGTDRHSFPSGHTSMAFCGATILHKEFGKKSAWISVAGYSVALFTAADRVIRNRHHWGDVVAGAVIGIGSAEAGYRLGDLMTGWKKNVDVAIMPDGFCLI